MKNVIEEIKKEAPLVFKLAKQISLTSMPSKTRMIKKKCYDAEAFVCFESEKPISKII